MLIIAMHPLLLQVCAFVLLLSMILLFYKIISTTEKTTKVLCLDIISIQCLSLSIILGMYGLGIVALQFGFAVALLGFISSIILSHLIRS